MNRHEQRSTRSSGYGSATANSNDRQDASERARITEFALQGILDNSTSVIYVKDIAGRYIMINRRYEELFHVTADQIIGRTDDEVHSPEIAEKFQANDRKVRESRRPLEFEETAIEDDGKHVFVSVKFPILDSAGEVFAVGGVSTDITERKQANEALTVEGEFLRRTIEFQDHEHQLLAYDIHDGLLQYAAGALMHLQALQDNVDALPVAEPINTAADLLRKVIAEGRRVINGLRTPVLDDCGVVSALEQLFAEEERAHFQIEFIKDEDFGRLAAKSEEALFRIAQESLTNAHKHARAKRIRVQLTRRGDNVHLEVRDWGVGFDMRKDPTGIHGLRGMAERARIAGGQCTVESRPGKGTRVIVDLPYLVRE